jgi:hypothetical protein
MPERQLVAVQVANAVVTQAVRLVRRFCDDLDAPRAVSPPNELLK